MGRPKVLIVDDNPSVVTQEKQMLSDFNFDIITAADGTEAIKKVTTEKPFLVLLDLILPKINGDAVCKYIKEHPELHDTAVIIVTSKDDPNYLERCFRSGCDAYVVKPLHKDDLNKKIRIIMQEKGLD